MNGKKMGGSCSLYAFFFKKKIEVEADFSVFLIKFLLLVLSTLPNLTGYDRF